jgi:hypothetical protein
VGRSSGAVTGRVADEGEDRDEDMIIQGGKNGPVEVGDDVRTQR